jgi:erythromycin esterase-like protein
MYRAHRYIQNQNEAPADKASVDALGDFNRFPSWMWQNECMAKFLEVCRFLNKSRKEYDKVGVYGLDLYSLFASAEAVIDYLESVDKRAANIARKKYCEREIGYFY